jgi:hypothetical protein
MDIIKKTADEVREAIAAQAWRRIIFNEQL